MLVHDIRKNESQVIDFRETAPFEIQEEVLQKASEAKVRQSSILRGFCLCVHWSQFLLLPFPPHSDCLKSHVL